MSVSGASKKASLQKCTHTIAYRKEEGTSDKSVVIIIYADNDAHLRSCCFETYYYQMTPVPFQ